MTTLDILERLIGFPTISRDPNRALIDYCAGLLDDAGVAVTLIEAEGGAKANLYATIGPKDRPGVMLSGHTDVVPIDGQDWHKPAFQMTVEEGRAYGRGTCDMKGFVAAALRAARLAAKRPLRTPLHLGLSHDEEIGCIGVRSLVDMLADAPIKPAMCIVGEPTAMAVATGHKGKTALKATCHGREGHSALAPLAANALHLGADLIGALRALQADLAASGHKDGDYDVPYTTVHAGKFIGGVALNIVPNLAELDFEIRNLAQDDPSALLAQITATANAIAAGLDPDARIEIQETFAYPGLDTPIDAGVVNFVKRLTGSNGTIKVAFGTEGGLFSDALGIPTVICGPGSMAQGHKPDEYVSLDQLARCDAMLNRLLDALEAGL